MNRLIRTLSTGNVRPVIAGTLFLAGCFLFAGALARSSDAGPASDRSGEGARLVSTALSQAVLGAPQPGGELNPAHVMGTTTCVQCHKSEYLAWRTTKHYPSQGTITGTGGNIAKYAEAVGIKPSDVLKDSRCTKCHATTQADRGGKVRVISGVSCESCHGGSGGENGWLNRHAVYGPNVTPPDKETAKHKKDRIDYCEKAGMIRGERLYAIAKNCQQCHSITNEKLVNAGHKPGEGFELVGWSVGEVRHNFHENQSVNGAGPSLWMKSTGGKTAERKRVKFTVGVLVDLEVSLAALASATEGEGDFIDAYVERVGVGLEYLEGILEVLEDDAPDELGKVLEAVEGAEVEDADFSKNEARDAAAAAAKQIRDIAVKFAARDGSKLAAVDEFLNDAVEVKGKEYSR